MRVRGPLSLLASIVLLASCGGGAAPAVTPGAAQAPAASGTLLTVRISVPETGAASSRRPLYVSPATQSIAVAVLDANNLQVGGASANLIATSPSCQTASVNGVTTLACSMSMPVSVAATGTYTVATVTLDQPQTQTCSPTGTPRCAGNVLSASYMPTTLTLNATNAVAVVLGGLATGFAVTPVLNGFMQGSAQFGLHMYGSQLQQLAVAPLDADGNTIIGSGAPAVTIASSSATLAVGTSSPGVFSLHATTSGSPPIVTPGTLTLTLTATPVNSPATPYSQTIALKLDHTAVFVSNGSAVPVFLDGNTTASGTLPDTSSPRGIAVASPGGVFVGNHTQTGTVTECTDPNNLLTCSVPVTGTPNVEGVAIDPAGNLWTTYNGSTIAEYLAGQTTAHLTIVTTFTTLRGVSVDTNGKLWVADQSTNTIAGYAAPFTSTSTPAITLNASNGISAPIQVSSDASGNLWAALSTGGAVQFAPPITSASRPAITLGTANGVNAPQGVAIDAVASIWIANNGNGTVTHCLPPAGTIACTSFSVPGALWIAAFPADLSP